MITLSFSETIEPLLQGNNIKEAHSFLEWKQSFCDAEKNEFAPSNRAIWAGYQASCVGFAFASGYQCALQSLVPTLPANKLSALCVTEESGNHPRQILSTISNHQDPALLNGSKKFITGGLQADSLLVAAKAGEDEQQRPIIKLIKIDSQATGVSMTQMPSLPFVPEIDHATVSFDNVKCSHDAILPGDGYADYVKPFRTVEDIFVSLALSSYLLKIAVANGFPNHMVEQALAIIASHKALAIEPPADSATHLLLAGCRAQLEQALPEFEEHWQQTDSNSFTTWQRDKALLNIVGTARQKRTETAWKKYRM